MAFDYTNLSQCIGRVSTITETEGVKDTEILYQLQDTGATKGAATTYRPFYVAAMIEQQNYDTQQLSEASKAKFTNNKSQIESWLRYQLGFDQGLIADGWAIPQGFDAASKLNALCGCQDGGLAAGVAIMSIATI